MQPLLETIVSEVGREEFVAPAAGSLALTQHETVSLVPTVFSYHEDEEVALGLKHKKRSDLLTAEEEVLLAKRIEAGVMAEEAIADLKTVPPEFLNVIRSGQDAKARFIEANQRLIYSIAKRYPLPKGMDLEDLVQEGNIGLNRAVEKFEWQRGNKFSTYATRWIKQSLQRALADTGTLIRVPEDRRRELREAKKLRDTKGIPLSPEQAELDQLTSPASLDAPLGDDGDASLGDKLAVSPEQTDTSVLLNQVTPENIERFLYKALEKRHETLRAEARKRGYKKTSRGIPDQRRVEALMIHFGFRDEGKLQSFKEVGKRLGDISHEMARKMIRDTISFVEESDELRSFFEIMAGQQR